ncbi:MAG TPA: ATP-binding protein [Alphaproteobacteria bacterium]|nr:ATP-binding protein [Alphaproteobacteria bacterium]
MDDPAAELGGLAVPGRKGSRLDPEWRTAQPLSSAILRRCCDPADLDFATTDELPPLAGLVGQERAIDAIQLGIAMRRHGFNVFAFGPAGTGKHTLIQQLLERQAASEEAPSDWSYVNNFSDARRPRCLRLPAGRAAPLRDAMKRLVADMRIALPAAFEREDYRARREVIDQQIKHCHEEAFGALQQKAEKKGVGLIRTPMGLALAPLRNGEVIPPDAFNRLPAEERHEMTAVMQSLQGDLEAVIRRIPDWEREHRDAVRQLNRDTTAGVVKHLLQEVRTSFADLGEVITHLNDVEQDILEHADDFIASSHPDGPSGASLETPVDESASFRRYQVNVLVDNAGCKGAPIVYEDNPTHQNLVGRIEHIARFGTLMTDFNLVVAGALHKANGGYLVLDAQRLLTANFGWESLKRTLRAGEIRTVSLEQLLSLASTVSLDPHPIPLEVKVVLIGSPLLYFMLSELDVDFPELFKIAAEFDDRVDRTPENIGLYARLIATAVRRENLRPLDRAAVARTIEEAARLSGDAAKLSAQLRGLTDLLQEADHIAAKNGGGVVDASHIEAASMARRRRSDRIYRRIQEEIARNTLRIETEGERVGQVNGLSVITIGGVGFGQPSRITAQVRLGKGEVIDIEREVALGGPIHSKGVLILAGFLGGRFGRSGPLTLTASLVFEQSYGGVEGDSASAAELFALLSALSETPISQSFAVTGSLDQHGRIQAIGGVNEKIEGFFDVCRARGLTGTQGVLIPSSNVQHLMLRRDVAEAAAAGLFRVIPIDHVDQGMELLTGSPSGAADLEGHYPESTLNRRIAARLAALAKRAAPSPPPRVVRRPTKRARSDD